MEEIKQLQSELNRAEAHLKQLYDPALFTDEESDRLASKLILDIGAIQHKIYTYRAKSNIH